MLWSSLCDFGDAYIAVKGTITLKKAENFFAFKSNSPFTKCISKINNVLIKNVEDLDIVILYGIITGMNLILLPLIIIMQISLQILSLLNTKTVLQEKYQMQIKKTVKTLSKKIERLKKILKLLCN